MLKFCLLHTCFSSSCQCVVFYTNKTFQNIYTEATERYVLYFVSARTFCLGTDLLGVKFVDITSRFSTVTMFNCWLGTNISSLIHRYVYVASLYQISYFE